jgi:hypothetical protein
VSRIFGLSGRAGFDPLMTISICTASCSVLFLVVRNILLFIPSV